MNTNCNIPHCVLAYHHLPITPAEAFSQGWSTHPRMMPHVMTPQLKPDYPDASDISTPPPLAHRLRPSVGYQRAFTPVSSMVTLAVAAAARSGLACTVTLQLSPGTDPSQGNHCSHGSGWHIWIEMCDRIQSSQRKTECNWEIKAL